MSYAYQTPDYTASTPPQAPHRPRSSFYPPASPPEEQFDVRADFDGDGPRWSDRYGPPQPLLSRDHHGSSYGSERGYKPVDDHVAPKSGGYGAAGSSRSEAGEEMVSVPVLGPDWQKSELYDLSRRGRADIKSEKRTLAWRAWNRGQAGLCGVKWLSKRLLVFIIFFFLVALGVTLYFTIPRNPAFTFYIDRPFDVDNSTISFSRTPTNFSFNGNLNLYADATSSYLPVQFFNLQARLYDLDTNKVIATGDLGRKKIDNGVNQPVVLPVTFSYSALNATDPTWLNIYDGCGHLWPGTERPDLKLRLVLQSSIVGLTSKPEQSTSISDIPCPFELGVNSV